MPTRYNLLDALHDRPIKMWMGRTKNNLPSIPLPIKYAEHFRFRAISFI